MVGFYSSPDATPHDDAALDGATGDAATDTASPPDSSGSDAGADTATPPDAGSDAPPGGPKGIFLTRATYYPDFGGLKQGDFRCQSSAAAAGFGGTWKAWLSDTQTDAASRIVSDGPWIAVVTGVTLFPNRAALRGYPLAALQTDELGKIAPDRWWTGTLANGVRAPDTCSDWSTKAQFPGGMTGYRATNGVPGKEWTEDVAFSCQDTFALLCLQD
jgi:hypothetical protein